MLPLSASVEMAKNEALKERINMAFNIIAHEMILESSDTEHHILRHNHANMILQLQKERIDAFVEGIFAAPAIQNSFVTSPEQITDEQILESVRQVWNSLIGIS
jgi:hypothetical protein